MLNGYIFFYRKNKRNQASSWKFAPLNAKHKHISSQEDSGLPVSKGQTRQRNANHPLLIHYTGEYIDGARAPITGSPTSDSFER